MCPYNCYVTKKDIPGMFKGNLNLKTYLYVPARSIFSEEAVKAASSSRNVTCSVQVVLSPFIKI